MDMNQIAEESLADNTLKNVIQYIELQQQSKRSLQSGPSVITGDSRLSDSNFGLYELYFLENDAVLVRKYPTTMRKLDHENINRFIGLSIDGAQYAADLIAKGSLLFDPFFMLCIMRDVAEGLKYLHNSFIGVHGSLSSQCCLVNDSWQVKLADYGTGSLREDDRVKKKRKHFLCALLTYQPVISEYT
ncbi:hypothetical protein COOONC_12722 [Cooperia oncophora]